MRSIDLDIEGENIDIEKLATKFPFPITKHLKDLKAKEFPHREVITYSREFENSNNLSHEIKTFLTEILAYKSGLAELKKMGYKISMTLFFLEEGNTMRIFIERKTISLMAEFCNDIYLCFSNETALLKHNIKKRVDLSPQEKSFLISNYSKFYCSGKIIFLESKEELSESCKYELDFNYSQGKEKEESWKYFCKQVLIRQKIKKIKNVGVVKAYIYHAWWSDWQRFDKQFLRDLKNINTDLEITVFSGGWVYREP